MAPTVLLTVIAVSLLFALERALRQERALLLVRFVARFRTCLRLVRSCRRRAASSIPSRSPWRNCTRLSINRVIGLRHFPSSLASFGFASRDTLRARRPDVFLCRCTTVILFQVSSKPSSSLL